MKIYNTNDKYGFGGPFDADNFEALADEMMTTINDWAQEKLDEIS